MKNPPKPAQKHIDVIGSSQPRDGTPRLHAGWANRREPRRRPRSLRTAWPQNSEFCIVRARLHHDGINSLPVDFMPCSPLISNRTGLASFLFQHIGQQQTCHRVTIDHQDSLPIDRHTRLVLSIQPCSTSQESPRPDAHMDAARYVIFSLLSVQEDTHRTRLPACAPAGGLKPRPQSICPDGGILYVSAIDAPRNRQPSMTRSLAAIEYGFRAHESIASLAAHFIHPPTIIDNSGLVHRADCRQASPARQLRTLVLTINVEQGARGRSTRHGNPDRTGSLPLRSDPCNINRSKFSAS